MKILVVEDDTNVIQVLKLLLSSYNYAVDIATDGETGQQMANAFNYDLVVLDLVLPKLDGVTLCQQLRAKQHPTPILLLTGQSDQRKKVEALNAGADDYVVKPFDAEELMARVQALLRRRTGVSQPILQWGDLLLDPKSQRITYGDTPLTLTPKEFAILELLLRRPQQVLSAQIILDHVWNSTEFPGEETVRFHIKALRKKLKASGASTSFIKTVYGVGYGLNPAFAAPTSRETAPTPERMAELNLVNQELRLALEQLQIANADLERQVQVGVTALQRTSDRLQQQQQQWRIVFNHAAEGIIVADTDGYPLEINPSACRLLGRSLDALRQSPLATMIHPRSDFIRAWEQMLQTGELRGAFTLQPPDTPPCSVQLVASAYINRQHHLVMLVAQA